MALIYQGPTPIPMMSGVAPNFNFMVVGDNLSTVTTAGYLNSFDLGGVTLNNTDVLMTLYSFNQQSQVGSFAILTVSITAGVITLTSWGGAGDVVLPTITNYIAHFTNTAGTLSSGAGNITNAGNIQAGLSGTAGVLISYPATAATGSLSLTAAVNAGNYANILTNASTAAARTWTLPDASGTIALTSSGVPSIQGTANQVLVNGTSGSPVSGTAITLTTPQNIATTSSPTFAALTLTSALTVPNGGTGLQTAAAYAVLTGGTTTTGALQSVSGLGTTGQVLTSNGAGALPSWQAASGSGTVNSGTANQLAYYASTGTAVSGVGPGSAGQLFQSNGSGSAPAYTTATYPAIATSAGTILRADGTNWVASTATFANTYAASTLLYSNGANTVTGLATANSAVLVTNSTGVPVWSSTMTNGQVIIGSTGATPVAATLTEGNGISITNGAGSITISTSGSGYDWTEVTGTTQQMDINNGYIANNGSLVTLTLPAVSTIGDSVILQGKGAGLFKIEQNAGQTIHFGDTSTTTGVTGGLTAVNRYNSVELVCITNNTDWAVITGTQGAFTVV